MKGNNIKGGHVLDSVEFQYQLPRLSKKEQTRVHLLTVGERLSNRAMRYRRHMLAAVRALVGKSGGTKSTVGRRKR